MHHFTYMQYFMFFQNQNSDYLQTSATTEKDKLGDIY